MCLGQGADMLQRATSLDTIVFDKTGTLTTGRPSVTNTYFDSSVPGVELFHVSTLR